MVDLFLSLLFQLQTFKTDTNTKDSKETGSLKTTRSLGSRSASTENTKSVQHQLNEQRSSVGEDAQRNIS